MADSFAMEQTLAAVVLDLTDSGQRFALVGGLAVSVRAEIRFTRDVDLAVHVATDDEAESLVFQLRERQYRPLAVVEHETKKRLATARLLSASGVKWICCSHALGSRLKLSSERVACRWLQRQSWRSRGLKSY